MGNTFLAYPDRTREAATVLAGGSWDGTLTRANLQDPLIGKPARTANATLAATQWTTDLGQARSIQLLALLGHNLSKTARVRIRGGSDASFATFNYDSGQTVVGNILTYSQDFSNAVWTKSFASTLTGQADPIGGTTATRWTVNAAGQSLMTQISWGQQLGQVCVSFYLKKGSLDIISAGSTYTGILATFDLTTVTATPANGSTVNIAAVAGGWYRCTVAWAHPNQYCDFQIAAGYTYTGDALSGNFYTWGVQGEIGVTVASAYTATTAAASSTTTFNQRAWPASFTDDEVAVYPNHLILPLAAPVTGRYWKTEISDPDNPHGFIDIGRAPLCPVWAPTVGINQDVSAMYEPRTVITESLGGVSWPDIRPARRVQMITFPALDDDERGTGLIFQKTIGNSGEIIFVEDYQYSAKDLLLYAYPATIRRVNPITAVFFKTNELPMEIAEII